ncbi:MULTISPECIES: ethanolamine ammonia-lyase subunit EutC [unclassified Pseudofrankia]|uniref:ethanolamine ammonia-lyase subunit EutC n=1 Tax=unclassified Pseudofrankia TaxID=2994372 RepID=UPI0008DA0194|nr:MULTISPECIES: ethanolamine ammonia-lyase subunit EutC [unclassified Pseudofrankia]MDT3439971.1 ethanolamine ammonia-lyase subunit EutC [Pseudofrankia sp. BMG5.37]OHV48431.1 ethanolamine ammonia-lyase [Pseudofrankia sp. BMG5.36]
MDVTQLARRVRAVTPARIFVGRIGTSYGTAQLLALRADHAAARDAVTANLTLTSGPLAPLAERYGLFAVDSAADDRTQYLRRPDRGRRLSSIARDTITARCPHDTDLQVVIGDGLSAAAIEAQVPGLLPLLLDAADQAGWSIGQTFAVNHCRVGIMNDVGEILHPKAVVLLIGERPGLATAQSMSAYLAWRPRAHHTDADRNLLSNIHPRGIAHPDAVSRIIALIRAMRATGASGITLKEPDRRGPLDSDSVGTAP